MARTGSSCPPGTCTCLKRDYDRAIDYFRELQERFPHGNRAAYAHWKAAWLSFRQGRIEDARTGFESQIALYPDSVEVPAALYWRGRMAEEENDPGMARAFYQKLADRYRNYYYAELGRERLKSSARKGEPHRLPTRCTTRCSIMSRRCRAS